METIPTQLSEVHPADLFPPECHLRWSRPRPLSDLAFGSERSLATTWAEKVQELFAAGRFSAHEAIKHTGLDTEPIGRGANGVPLWPKEIQGSITHTEGMALAVVSRAPEVLALGIDIEKVDRQLQLGLISKVSSSSEAQWVNNLPDPTQGLLRLLSAKEAIFKAVFSLSGIRLGFREANLLPCRGGFEAQLLHPRVSKEWLTIKLRLRQGHWKGYLVSGLCLKKPIPKTHAPS